MEVYDIENTEEEIEVMGKLGGEEKKIESIGDKAVKNDELEKEDTCTQEQKNKEDTKNQEMTEKEEENEYILGKKNEEREGKDCQHPLLLKEIQTRNFLQA